MKKSEEYIKKNPEYDMCLVDKKFGNGKLLIKFFYNRQINGHNQGFLAYVDNQKWLKDNHEVMQEVEDYLANNGTGVIYDEDFVNDYNEDFDADITLEDVEGDDELSKKYEDWFKEQFPKIDLIYGGVCHFSAVS